MSSFADVVIAFLDLMDAEARAMRTSVLRLGVSLAVVLVAALLIGGGLGLILWGVFLLLESLLGAPQAALVSGAFTLLVAGALLWSAKRLVQ